MKPRAEFLSLAEELQAYILSLLSYQDILRCTFVCKALRQTYMSSSELQYIIELGGQRLIPVPNADFHNHTSISKRLQLLRDKAHAWFKFDIHSFETVSIPEQFHNANVALAHGHLYLFDDDKQSAKIFPILPKSSQQTIERDWSPGSLCSIPNADIIDVFMDPAENLIAIAYIVLWPEGNERFYIDIGVLDGDRVHPKAAGQTLFLSRPGFQDDILAGDNLTLEGCGRHIAFRCSQLIGDDTFDEIWWLQIWDWQHSTTSSCVLSGAILNAEGGQSFDFSFLGNDRLLTVSNLKNLHLYSIEDLSQAPQLLARFAMPVSVTGMQYLLSMEDIAHRLQSQMQTQHTMWTSDPENQILCLVTGIQSLAITFVISTRIFFDLDVFQGMAPIPWDCWGLLNTRVFPHQSRCRVGVRGNRVLQAFPEIGTADLLHPIGYRLHMMDFSPLAVERRQGLGIVVTEPSTIEITDSGEKLTTSLPYVEVVSDRIFGADQLIEIWVDEDRIYLPKLNEGTINQLEVIEIQNGVCTSSRASYGDLHPRT